MPPAVPSWNSPAQQQQGSDTHFWQVRLTPQTADNQMKHQRDQLPTGAQLMHSGSGFTPLQTGLTPLGQGGVDVFTSATKLNLDSLTPMSNAYTPVIKLNFRTGFTPLGIQNLTPKEASAVSSLSTFQSMGGLTPIPTPGKAQVDDFAGLVLASPSLNGLNGITPHGLGNLSAIQAGQSDMKSELSSSQGIAEVSTPMLTQMLNQTMPSPRDNLDSIFEHCQ
jgi:hypothetical protein